MLLARNSISAFYKHVNAKMSTSRGGVAPLIVNNNTLISDTDQACTLHAYFSSIFSPRDVTTLPLSGADKPISNDVHFSQAVVYKALKNSKRTLSSGPDDILSIFWAKLAAILALPISTIFSASYHFAILPDEWKSARISPLFKEGDPSIVGKYRPISLTSTLCKVMETIIKDNLLSHAISNNIINHNQHGSIPGRSTCSQVLETQYDLCSGLSEGGIYDVIMIGFRKAFDVVPHNKLITKLHNLGVCKQTLQWLIAFLSDRRKCVCLNSACSTSSYVTGGVIQGSVLGPLLFTMYINDLPAQCPDCEIKLFPDDVKAYKRVRSASDRTALQASLK